MVKMNPYETNTPVDVPNFMKQDIEPKKVEDNGIDMSVFKLKEEELRNTNTGEIKVKRKPKRKNRINSLLGTVTIVCVLVAAIALVLFISSSNKYKSLLSEYETYKSTAENKFDRVNEQLQSVQKEFDDYKATLIVEEPVENEQTDKEEEKPATTTTSLKAGEYTINSSIYIRSGAGADNSVVKFEDLPQNIQWIAYANSTTVAGAKINVKEIKVVSDTVWGKLADNVWVCLKNGNAVYVE